MSSAADKPALDPADPALGAGALAAPRRTRRLQPLAPEDRARADRVARRLYSEITSFIAAMPAEARNASGLARHLGIDRTTCQRAVFAVSNPYAGPELFSRLPGVRGLRLMVVAAGASQPEPDQAVLDALVTAIEQFQALITATGGSLTKLTRRLEGGDAADRAGAPVAHDETANPSLRSRMQIFEAAAQLTGRSSESWVAVYAYRPSPADPGRVEVFRANGLAGHRARPDSVPLIVHNFSGAENDTERDTFASLENAEVKGRSPTVVLEDFTSSPVPLVTARQPDEFLVQAIDQALDEPAPSTSTDRPMDLMLATRTSIPHPARQSPPIEEIWALVNFPCRQLYFDVYLHRDLARACIPSLDAHLWGPDFAQHVGDRWQTRLADCPPLQILGPGLHRSAPTGYPRLPELTEHLFARAGLAESEYVGFRCVVEYPLWRTGYCISLDYTGPTEPESD